MRIGAVGTTYVMATETVIDELAASGDVGAMIAAMLVSAGDARERAADDARNAAIAREEAAGQAKLEHMREAASQRFAGGVAAGVSSIASGGILMGAGASRSDAHVKDGLARSVEGGGKVASVLGDFAATTSDVAREADEQALARARREVETASSDARGAAEDRAKAVVAYRDHVAAKNAALRAALLG